MATKPPFTVEDTDKAFNREVPMVGELTLDEMQDHLATVAAGLGLAFSHITKLGAKRYAGNRHWHLKQGPKIKGCLDITYWPPGPTLWITMRKSEPAWVIELGNQLAADLEKHLAGLRVGGK